MAFLELSNVRKVFPNAQAAAVENFDLAVSTRRVRVVLGTQRLRQDDDAAHGGRL